MHRAYAQMGTRFRVLAQRLSPARLRDICIISVKCVAHMCCILHVPDSMLIELRQLMFYHSEVQRLYTPALLPFDGCAMRTENCETHCTSSSSLQQVSTTSFSNTRISNRISVGINYGVYCGPTNGYACLPTTSSNLHIFPRAETSHDRPILYRSLFDFVSS